MFNPEEGVSPFPSLTFLSRTLGRIVPRKIPVLGLKEKHCQTFITDSVLGILM